MINCSKCNTLVRANARFCSHCRAPIQPPVAVASGTPLAHTGGMQTQKMAAKTIGPYRVERLLRKDDNVYIVTPVDAPGAKGVRVNYLAIETARKRSRETLPKISAMKLHKNILRFMGQLEDERHAQFLIVECPPGEPLDLIAAPLASKRALNVGLQLTMIVDYLHKHKFTFELGGEGDALKRFQKAFLLDADDHLYFFDYRILAKMPGSVRDENSRIREDVLLIIRTFLHFLTGKSIKHLIDAVQADYQYFKTVLPNLLKHPPTNLKNLTEIFNQLMPPTEMPSDVTRRLWQPQIERAKTVKLTTPPAITFAALTDTGRQRDHNEDNYLVLPMDATSGLFIVADGMGGHAAGEVASQIAIDELKQCAAAEWAQLQNGASPEIVRGLFHNWVKAANEKIYTAGQGQGNTMGATFTGALILNRQVYTANVGDSRTYLARGGELYPLTWDHSLVASLVRAGLLEPDGVYDHSQRNEVFRALGQKSDVSVDVFDPVDLIPGDRVLVCSDGLWEMVRSPQMKEILARLADPTTCCAELVRVANEQGGEDNITVVLVQIF